MHRLRRAKRWLALWLITAVLGHFGLSHQDASAFVLCFGADGHVAVEPAEHDHGAEAAYASEGANLKPSAYSLKGDRSPCTDFPVTSDDHGAHKPLSGSLKPALDLPLVALVALVLIFNPIREKLAKPVFPRGPPFIDPGLPALRSVILLI